MTVIDARCAMGLMFAASSMRLLTLQLRQELRSEVNVRVAGCFEVTFSSRRCDCGAGEPSCSADSCLSLSDLSSLVVSGSLDKRFAGATKILKSMKRNEISTLTTSIVKSNLARQKVAVVIATGQLACSRYIPTDAEAVKNAKARASNFQTSLDDATSLDGSASRKQFKINHNVN